jgi:hypothetical protein
MRMRMMRIIIITFSYYRTYRKGKIRMGDGERRPILDQKLFFKVTAADASSFRGG